MIRLFVFACFFRVACFFCICTVCIAVGIFLLLQFRGSVLLPAGWILHLHLGGLFEALFLPLPLRFFLGFAAGVSSEGRFSLDRWIGLCIVWSLN